MLEIPFKGNVDLKKLEDGSDRISERKNSSSRCAHYYQQYRRGQPVSMKYPEASLLCRKYGAVLWLIQPVLRRMPILSKPAKDENKTIREIVKEIFRMPTSMTMSSGNAIVNIWAVFWLWNRKSYGEKCQMYCIVNEGFIIQGMSGRDNTLWRRDCTKVPGDYLSTSIKQRWNTWQKTDDTVFLSSKWRTRHFVDAPVLIHIRKNLASSDPGYRLSPEAGIRGVEIGLLADRDPVTDQNRYRAGIASTVIPHTVYQQSYRILVAIKLKNVYSRRTK